MDAIIAELRRQAEASAGLLHFREGQENMVVSIDGDIELDPLARAILAALDRL
jgi:hypothetical protein